MKRNKKKCPHCDREISLSNYNSHVSSCQIQRKPSFSVSNWLKDDGKYYCPECEFNDSRQLALVTHYYRKHTMQGQQLVKDTMPWKFAAEKEIWNKGQTKYINESLMKLSKSLMGRRATFKGKNIVEILFKNLENRRSITLKIKKGIVVQEKENMKLKFWII